MRERSVAGGGALCRRPRLLSLVATGSVSLGGQELVTECGGVMVSRV